MIIPRYYQDESITAIYNYFLQGGRGNPIVALPTAAGKSIIPALFIERVMRLWNNQRFLVMVHSTKLVQQNAAKLEEVWPNAPYGIYAADLNKRDILQPIIFGTIQSMVKIAAAFGWRDIIFIDECHLVSQDESSMYFKFIAILKAINPNLKVVGLTATKFRMGQGLLTEDGLFTDIIYDMTDIEGFNKLLSEGYLCPLIPKPTKTELDVSNVGTLKGEFIQKQLEHEVDKAEVTWAAVNEGYYYGKDRQSWMIFASGISHSDHIAQMVNELGIQCASIHSKQSKKYNDAALEAHKNLELKAIVSFSKITTGLDHPAIDFMMDLAPTLSIVRHIQKYGRPMRPHPGKINSLCLDFARNIPRLGPVNDPMIPKKKGDKGGDIPIKLCEACGVYNHISARFCSACNEPFSFETKFKATAGTEQLIKTNIDIEAPIIETHDVTYVIYTRKQKPPKAAYLAVTYFCGMKSFKEFVFPENYKFPKQYADWWRQRNPIDPPKTTDECINHVSELRAPRRIRVHMNRKYNGKDVPEVLSAEF